MSELISNIFKIKKSKSYIDYKNYHKGNIFGITKMSRRELMHSNFIAWALDPSASHALGFYPMYQLVRALDLIQGSADNINARKIEDLLWYKFYDDDFIIDVSVEREVAIPVGKNGKNKFIDLLIVITTKEKVLPIIIENKVESKENGTNNDQTQVYFDWCENQSKYQDTSQYFQAIYIYLYPEYNSDMQTAKEYIRMTYQELVDYILEPSMAKCGDMISVANYKTYLQCLSYQSDNEKGAQSMAISSEEKKILMNFVKENEDLLCAVINKLDGVDPDALSAVTNGIRDSSQYEFLGNTYGKGRLVLAVVSQYVTDGKASDFSALQKAFPDNLQGAKGVVRISNSVSNKDKGIGGIKRYFIKADEVIKLASGEKVLVSDQWGAGNIDKFIENATTNLGYKINKV